MYTASQKQNLLMEVQKVNDPNPLYELAQDVALHNCSGYGGCEPPDATTL